MRLFQSLLAGLAGSVALTATHQLLRQVCTEAPRMDLMGEEALLKISGETGRNLPQDKLYGITMAGDIAGNTLYYALTGCGDRDNAVARGTALGLAAGIGGVVLPKYLGLTNAYSNRSTTTQLLTIGIYTLGGLVAGIVLKACSAHKEEAVDEPVTLPQ